MIIYNVKRQWFTMKNDAEAYRRAEKLPVDATFKLEIKDRDDLARLLNGLSGIKAPAEADQPVPDTGPAPAEVIERNRVEVPEFIPKFLVEEWRKNERRRAARDEDE